MYKTTISKSVQADAPVGHAEGERLHSIKQLVRITLWIASPFLIAMLIATAASVFSARPLYAILRNQLLSIEPRTLRFEAHQADIVTKEFTVRNTNGHPMELLGGNSNCGCTVITDGFPILLPASGATKVHVRMKVGSPDALGKFVKSVTILVNREGTVPPLVVEATVLGSNRSP